MQRPKDALGPEWVRCESKLQAGQYFMFNKKSGETKWCTHAVNNPQRNLSVSRITKTPAQDRLKRLQSNLKTKQVEPNTSGGERCIGKHHFESKRIETKSVTDRDKAPGWKTNVCGSTKTSSKSTLPVSGPSTLTTNPNANQCKLKADLKNFAIPKTLQERLKIRTESGVERLALISNERAQLCKTAPKVRASTVVSVQSMKPNTLNLQNTKKRVNESYIASTRDLQPSPIKKYRPNTVESPVQQPPIIKSTETLVERPSSRAETCSAQHKNTSKSEQKLNFLTKIREFCNNLFNKETVKTRTQKHIENEEGLSKLASNSKPKFKAKKKNQKFTPCSVLQENESRKIQSQSTALTEKDPNQAASLPIHVSNESANARLKRLRTSLQLQQSNIVAIPSASAASTSSDLTSEGSYTSAYTSDPEPMDWQPIAEESSEKPILSTSLPEQRLMSDSSRTSEHYTTVNENLLRSAAAKKSSNQWKTNHFYFVVDTNVFIQNLTFVEELTTMKLCDTLGTVIYVPYCVLQELDKLKVRSPSESIKTRSVRAIKYLNKTFEEKDQSIHVQSAVDEADHLISVNSPDDSILNCCLQVRKHVDNLLFLTEDINLQNKAMSSNILVSTKSDLISKH